MIALLALPLLLAQDDWPKVDDFTYQLQNVDPAAIGASTFDLAIVDVSRDGTEAGRWTADDLALMRKVPKRLLAYLSIGEAEDYRGYWKREWDANRDGKPDKGAPAWLGHVNPDWAGNYKVRYWDADWQKIVFEELDRVVKAGFDGVYLDIIDAYEFWTDRKTAERDMVEFVKAIAARARASSAAFAVFPQNGDGLAAHRDYVDVVTGIGREDLFFDGDKRQPAGETREAAANLDVFRKAGKLVLVTEYPTKKDAVDEVYRRAKERGFVPYATGRALDKLTVNAGHTPD